MATSPNHHSDRSPTDWQTIEETDEIYATQPSDDQDKAIFQEVKQKLGHKDKRSFTESLLGIYDENVRDINHVRESLYDYAKDNCENFPPGLLVRRRKTNAGLRTALEKYAQDIYYLFQYIEGGLPEHVLQSKVLSRSSLRNTSMSVSAQDNYDSDNFQGSETNTDTFEKKHSGETDICGLLLSHILQLKQCVAQSREATDRKLTALEMKLNDDAAHKNAIIENNNKTIDELTHKLEESESRRTELRAQLKLDSQDMKTQKDRIYELEHELLRLNYQVDNKLKSLENKLGSITSKTKPSYANAVKSPTTKHKGNNEQSTKTISPLVTFETSQNTSPPAQSTSGKDSHISEKTDQTNMCDSGVKLRDKVENIRPPGTVNKSPLVDLSNTDRLWDIYNDNSNDLAFCGMDVAEQKPNDDPARLSKTSTKSSQIYSIKSLAKTYSILEGVSRIRTKRVVLSNIKADKSFDDIKTLIFEYAQERHVRVTHARLLKKRIHYDRTETFTVQVNMAFDDYNHVINDKDFWPADIHCRDYIPRYRNYEQNGQYNDYNNDRRH